MYAEFHTARNDSPRYEATGDAQHPRATSDLLRTRWRILADLLSLISVEGR